MILNPLLGIAVHRILPIKPVGLSYLVCKLIANKKKHHGIFLKINFI